MLNLRGFIITNFILFSWKKKKKKKKRENEGNRAPFDPQTKVKFREVIYHGTSQWRLYARQISKNLVTKFVHNVQC